MKKILFCLLMFTAPCRAALVVMGDTTARTSGQIIANGCVYGNDSMLLGGTGTVIVDSIRVDARTNTSQPDTMIIQLYTDNGSKTAPLNRVSRDSLVITDGSTSTYTTYTIIPHVQISLTAGNYYWHGVSDKAETGGSFNLGTTATTVASCSYNKCGTTGDATWGSCTASSAPAFRISYWGHDATGGGSPTPHQVTLRDTVKLKAGVTIR